MFIVAIHSVRNHVQVLKACLDLYLLIRYWQIFNLFNVKHIDWHATFLSGYDYEIVFRKTEQHANADVLSMLPLQNDKK
jgi:hypothetical protein